MPLQAAASLPVRLIIVTTQVVIRFNKFLGFVWVQIHEDPKQ